MKMGLDIGFRRKWMLAGFAAAFLIGDLFLTFLKAGADMDSAGYLIGVAGFALAQIFWMVGQLREARPDGGWHRVFVGWGAAVNVAGLCTIALVPFDANGTVHNVGCYLATFGGAAILVARFRKGIDLVWTIWFGVLVIVFTLCIDLKAIPFSPYVPTTQKLLIASFAVWSGWIAWRMGGNSA